MKIVTETGGAGPVCSSWGHFQDLAACPIRVATEIKTQRILCRGSNDALLGALWYVLRTVQSELKVIGHLSTFGKGKQDDDGTRDIPAILDSMFLKCVLPQNRK